MVTSKSCAFTVKLFAISAVLSGCNSVTSSTSIDLTNQPDRPTFTEMWNEYSEIATVFSRYSHREHIPDVIPSSGSLTYKGTISISEWDMRRHTTDQILGQAFLDVDFSDNSINGTFTNFKGNDGTTYQGHLSTNNGTVSATEILGDINGHLTSDARHSQTVDAVGTMDAFFGGQNNLTHIFAYGNSIVWVTNAGMVTEETREMDVRIFTEKDY